MPYPAYRGYPDATTPEEFRKLLELRREALDEATRFAGLGSPLPVQWRHGWKAVLNVLGRDRDGSLKAVVIVTGPRGEVPYSRAVRLVTRRPLPYELGKTLREGE